jgi:hypothetical protein
VIGPARKTTAPSALASTAPMSGGKSSSPGILLHLLFVNYLFASVLTAIPEAVPVVGRQPSVSSVEGRTGGSGSRIPRLIPRSGWGTVSVAGLRRASRPTMSITAAKLLPHPEPAVARHEPVVMSRWDAGQAVGDRLSDRCLTRCFEREEQLRSSAALPPPQVAAVGPALRVVLLPIQAHLSRLLVKLVARRSHARRRKRDV